VSGNNGDRFLLAENRFLRDDVLETDFLNQYSDLRTSGPTYEADLTYTEPLGKNSSISAEYEIELRRNQADQKTYDYSEIENGYTRFNTGLSNVFRSDYLTQEAGLGYRYSKGRD